MAEGRFLDIMRAGTPTALQAAEMHLDRCIGEVGYTDEELAAVRQGVADLMGRVVDGVVRIGFWSVGTYDAVPILRHGDEPTRIDPGPDDVPYEFRPLAHRVDALLILMGDVLREKGFGVSYDPDCQRLSVRL